MCIRDRGRHARHASSIKMIESDAVFFQPLNFLHRSWGPLEPFDISVVDVLKNKGIYTHLITDHSHYFEDGGATYHNRYNSWEGFRGQEGDRWQPRDIDLELPRHCLLYTSE